MKRTFVLLLVVALAAAAFGPAAAAKKKKKKKKKPARIERVLDYTYDNPALGAPGVGGVTTLPSIVSGPKEKFVSIEQTDALSPLPFVRLSWDTDGDGTNDTGVTVCGGKTDKALAVPASTTFAVFPYVAPGPDCPTGSNTSGTIKFTFSNKP